MLGEKKTLRGDTKSLLQDKSTSTRGDIGDVWTDKVMQICETARRENGKTSRRGPQNNPPTSTLLPAE